MATPPQTGVGSMWNRFEDDRVSHGNREAKRSIVHVRQAPNTKEAKRTINAERVNALIEAVLVNYASWTLIEAD
jgi:hypothetical protein